MHYCTCSSQNLRNPDDSLREAERRARQTGDPTDIAAWVIEKLRAGEIDPNAISILVGAGHPIAVLVSGDASNHTRITQALLEASTTESIKLCLINVMQRILDSGVVPSFNLMTSVALRISIKDLKGESFNPQEVPRTLPHLPRHGTDIKLNMITYAMYALWATNDLLVGPVSPSFLVEQLVFPELADAFEFLGHAYPEGCLPAVLELGNQLLGI